MASVLEQQCRVALMILRVLLEAGLRDGSNRILVRTCLKRRAYHLDLPLVLTVCDGVLDFSGGDFRQPRVSTRLANLVGGSVAILAVRNLRAQLNVKCGLIIRQCIEEATAGS